MPATLDQSTMENRILEEVTYRKQLPGMSSLLCLEAVSCDVQKQTLELYHKVEAWEENVNGTMHGGIIAAVLDSTMGILCRCYIYPRRSPTTNLNVNYLRPVYVGDVLHVRAELLKQGKSLLWLRAVAWTETPEKPCASAEGTFYII